MRNHFGFVERSAGGHPSVVVSSRSPACDRLFDASFFGAAILEPYLNDAHGQAGFARELFSRVARGLRCGGEGGLELLELLGFDRRSRSAFLRSAAAHVGAVRAVEIARRALLLVMTVRR